MALVGAEPVVSEYVGLLDVDEFRGLEVVHSFSVTLRGYRVAFVFDVIFWNCVLDLVVCGAARWETRKRFKKLVCDGRLGELRELVRGVLLGYGYDRSAVGELLVRGFADYLL